MLEHARLGVFPMARLEHLPPPYLKRFCMRGTGPYEGRLRVGEDARKCVRFFQHNLLHDAPALGHFDVIFLRNVLIYFEPVQKREIVARMLARLEPGGLLFIGHAETLQGLTAAFQRVDDAVYQRVE